MSLLGTSPRTTLIGYAGAIATALIPALQGERITARSLVLAAVIALLGRFAKQTERGE